METLKDLVSASGGNDGTVLDFPDRTAPYTYSDFPANVWKSATLLGHYGVHPGATVTVIAGPKASPDVESDDVETWSPETARIDAADPVFALLGAMVVGATVELTPQEPVQSRVLVCPAQWSDRFETTDRSTIIAYGDSPENPAIVNFEEEMWSENPIEPPERVTPSDPALVVDAESYTHGELLTVAETIADEYGLESGSRVRLDASLTEPGAVVGGILAPLVAGATVHVPVAGDSKERESSEKFALTVTADADTNDVDGDQSLSTTAVTERLRETHRA